MDILFIIIGVSVVALLAALGIGQPKVETQEKILEERFDDPAPPLPLAPAN